MRVGVEETAGEVPVAAADIENGANIAKILMSEGTQRPGRHGIAHLRPRVAQNIPVLPASLE